jgi:hypothetical protein
MEDAFDPERAAKRNYNYALSRGMSDTCARHIDELFQCKQHYSSLPSKDARLSHRAPRVEDCFDQKQNVHACRNYYRKQMMENCVPQMKKPL